MCFEAVLSGKALCPDGLELSASEGPEQTGDGCQTDLQLSSVEVGLLLRQWSLQVGETLQGLHSAYEARDKFSLGHDDQLALVECLSPDDCAGTPGRTLIFIKLDKHRKHECMGRQAYLDRHGGIKWHIPGITPAKNYSNAVVVHPCIGVHMRKDHADRPTVPKHIAALKQCLELCLSAEDRVSAEDLELASELEHSLDPGECARCEGVCTKAACPLCRLCWHISCAAECVLSLQNMSDVKPFVPDGFDAAKGLPPTILNSVLSPTSSSSSSSSSSCAVLSLSASLFGSAFAMYCVLDLVCYVYPVWR